MRNELGVLSRRGFLGGLAAIARPESSGLKVGCQANAWPLVEGNFPQLLDALREMRQLGYTGFECNIRFVKGQFGNASAARKAIDNTGVRFIGAHTSMEAWQPDSFAVACAGVASLGAERIVMSARPAPTDNFSVALWVKGSRLAALAQRAHEEHIRIAYHNHNDEFARGNAEMEELVRLIAPEQMDFLVDAGHGYLGRGDPPAFVEKHSKRVFGFHIKTFRGQEQVPLGSGDFGFEKLASVIRSTGWTGWLITEEGGGAKSGNRAAVGPDRNYIRRVFGV